MNKREEYEQLMHAVQTGIATLQSGVNTKIFELKHMRVGIDSAMISDAALVQLLINKEICTLDEYYDQLIIAAKTEISRLEKEISDATGVKIKLA